jgi:aminoglycoside 6-adenylyltransferase
MRSEIEIKNLIIKLATEDDRIRAVLLNGSRANPKAEADNLQDFDIVCVVTEIDTFLSDHNWIDIFGERLLMQMPDEMTFGGENKKSSFSYLMLFKDGNRIDLTLFPVEKLESEFIRDSLTLLLVDKDNLFSNLPASGDKDYLINRPTEKEFSDCCNEFWWVSTYVAKGLWRDEITYAKDMLENHTRAMFLKSIEWYIGIKTDYSVSFGKSGKNMKDHLPPILYQKILSTYPDSKTDNIWNSLYIMTEVFSDIAHEIALTLHFRYNSDEEQNVLKYLKNIYLLHTK